MKNSKNKKILITVSIILAAAIVATGIYFASLYIIPTLIFGPSEVKPEEKYVYFNEIMCRNLQLVIDY